MAKIGIITYHFAGNYGAVLQCYALSRFLTNSGHDVHVINCITDKQNDNNSLYRKNKSIKSFIKNIVLLPFHKSRKLRFERYETFRRENMKRTRLVCNVQDLALLVNENNFDFLISGSDQVFNPNIYDFETTFLYPFLTKAKKIGYAVSIGKATSEQLGVYSGWIKDFANISVREESAADRLKCYFKNTPIVVDPVFLLDKTQWESLCVKTDRPYVLGYYINAIHRDQYINLSKKISQEIGAELIIVDARISKIIFNNKVITSAGPREFVELFMNAQFVCTDSFHGTSFSILLEKKFVCFEPKKNSLDTRKTNLCKTAGLEKQIYYLDSSSIVSYAPIDYKQVKERMLPMIDSSKEFLFDVLS